MLMSNMMANARKPKATGNTDSTLKAIENYENSVPSDIVDSNAMNFANAEFDPIPPSEFQDPMHQP